MHQMRFSTISRDLSTSASISSAVVAIAISQLLNAATLVGLHGSNLSVGHTSTSRIRGLKASWYGTPLSSLKSSERASHHRVRSPNAVDPLGLIGSAATVVCLNVARIESARDLCRHR